MDRLRNYSAPFYEGGIYHIFNRTNNKELLFRSNENKLFFLRQYQKFIAPFTDTFCYNLLPNHFHFLLRIKSTEEINNFINSPALRNSTIVEKEYLSGDKTADELIISVFRNFFVSYVKAFNKWHNRNGSLLSRPFRRFEIEKEAYFSRTIVYIHANAQHHKICKDFKDYRWSSYHSLLSNKPTLLRRNELFEWFGGRAAFINFHELMKGEYSDENQFEGWGIKPSGFNFGIANKPVRFRSNLTGFTS